PDGGLGAGGRGGGGGGGGRGRRGGGGGGGLGGRGGRSGRPSRGSRRPRRRRDGARRRPSAPGRRRSRAGDECRGTVEQGNRAVGEPDGDLRDPVTHLRGRQVNEAPVGSRSRERHDYGDRSLPDHAGHTQPVSPPDLFAF